MNMFGPNLFEDGSTTADYMDLSAFDEKFEIIPAKDHIRNLYHIENKYRVPVLEGGYRDQYNYFKDNLVHPDDPGYARLLDPDTMLDRFANSPEKGMLREEFRLQLVDGSYHWCQYIGITGTEHGVPEGSIYFYVYDIQNQKNRLEGRVRGRQYGRDSDPLTGLRKGDSFVTAMIEKTAGSTDEWCCIAFDIRNFRIFNSWYGYEKGNYLLSRIGTYLSEIEKKEDAVAAYYGRDTFALLLRYDRERIETMYSDISGFVSSYSNMPGFLPAFGVYILQPGSRPGFETYDKARLAVADAKRSYLKKICYFDSEGFEMTKRRFEFLTEFHNALVNDEITFYLQPQCCIADGRIIGAEALARWIRKDGSIANPGEFIPFLESGGFISELDKCVWDHVCRWLRSLIDRGITPVPVSVNVSQMDLLSMDVPAYLYSLTQTYSIPAKYINVEITESSYAENFESITNAVSELKRRGFLVLLDDFGAGYSSLNMLDHVNADVIKLDMLFMRKKNSLGKKGIGIVESIYGMTKALEMPVIVEGVETDEHVRFLSDLGFAYAQGYYFHRPLTISAFEDLLSDDSRIDRGGLKVAPSDLFHAQEILKESMFTEGTLNRILGPVAYYTLDGQNLTITRFNEPFRRVISDTEMLNRIENIQNYVVPADHPAMYRALADSERNPAEGGQCEIRFIKSDGSIFWFRMKFYYLRIDHDKKLFFGKVEDITEQRQQSLHFFDVLRKQSDVTMCIELGRNRISYVTGENTLYQPDLPSMELDKSVYRTALMRIDNESDRQAFLNFFDNRRLKEAYRRAVYHEVLNINFKLADKPEPVEFSTYYIRYNRDDNLTVYAFAKKRDREILSLDPLTGIKNRYAYNETVAMLNVHGANNDKLVAFSMDVNALKFTNDTFGHQAGDEIIKAAARGIESVISPYGSSFRIGGDEFAAFVYGDTDLAEYLKSELTRVLAEWTGTLAQSVSVSCGYAALQEFPGSTVTELIRMADLRMYRDKSRYYQQKNIDRRLQQTAFSAICNSYTKVLKVDLTTDSYEIIHAEASELTANEGYADTISGWLTHFADADMVHPEDKEIYLKYTSLDYLRQFFRSGQTRFSIYYRRIIRGVFLRVMLEIIAAPDYTNDDQKVFLYVKNIGYKDFA